MVEIEDEKVFLSAEEEEEMDDVALVSRRGGSHDKRMISRTDIRPITYSSTTRKTKCRYAIVTILLVLVAAVLALAVGLFVGQSLGRRAVRGGENPTPSPPTPGEVNWGNTIKVLDKVQNVTDFFTNQLNESVIRDYLSTLTALPHIAGSDRNRDLALMIHEEWQRYGFDSVKLYNYSVLLSYPNTSNPNTLALRQANGQLLYQSHIDQEPPLTPGENDSTVVPPFNAYSGSGNVTGRLVYVNYGSASDFHYLSNTLNLSLYNAICIVRYGGLYRGEKAIFAQNAGCAGLLIYSDPNDYAPEGTPVYPDGPALPQYGVQRGSLATLDGDLLTPGFPSIAGIHRRNYSEAQDSGVVPRIPVQPVSYGDAIHFMSQLTDHTPPDDWVGGLQIEYKIAQSDQNDNYTELVVNNYQEVRMIQNVVATLYGGVEPDRQVILGNHRDAWVFGAVDPNSGTAGLMNLAKVIGQLRELHDWRPGRTVVLCSWDAEEYGLIGSTEWVEDYGKLLGVSTIAYLNVDIAVSGSDHLFAQATPLMYEVVWQAAARVKCPNQSFATVYDEWLNATKKLYKGVYRPSIGNLGSGSDFTWFLQSQGISSASISSHGFYGVYHSVHDNFYWMSHFADPTFSRHRSTATVWILMALMLTTTPLPPYDVTHYGELLVGAATEVNSEYGQMLSDHGISLDLMEHSAVELQGAFQDFQATLTEMMAWTNISQQLALVRMVNDKLMNIERAFIHDEGLPQRSYFKHVVFAPSSINSYASSVFPGLSDAIASSVELDSGWEVVREQVDIVSTHLRYATQIVSDPSLQYALHNATR